MPADYLFWPEVKAFLDAADNVLNSNTFLLQVPVSPQDWQSQIVDYLMSKQFDADLLKQSKLRGWYNYDGAPQAFGKQKMPRFERIAKPYAYLIAMLAPKEDIQIPFLGYGFYSPYRKEYPQRKALEISNGLFRVLFGQEKPQAWAISPDFLVPKSDLRKHGYANFTAYFYGESGIPTDAATLLLSEQAAYLLLTNGND